MANTFCRLLQRFDGEFCAISVVYTRWDASKQWKLIDWKLCKLPVVWILKNRYGWLSSREFLWAFFLMLRLTESAGVGLTSRCMRVGKWRSFSYYVSFPLSVSIFLGSDSIYAQIAKCHDIYLQTLDFAMLFRFFLISLAVVLKRTHRRTNKPHYGVKHTLGRLKWFRISAFFFSFCVRGFERIVVRLRSDYQPTWNIRMVKFDDVDLSRMKFEFSLRKEGCWAGWTLTFNWLGNLMLMLRALTHSAKFDIIWMW